MSNADAWKKGIIDGYQSIKPSHIPPIPAYPAAVPAGIKDTMQYYYQIGYEKGRQMARGIIIHQKMLWGADALHGGLTNSQLDNQLFGLKRVNVVERRDKLEKQEEILQEAR